MEYYWIRSKTTSNNQKRTLRIMKVLFTFLFAALLSINAHTYSQETINLSVENKSLKEVFSEIEKKSSYIFLFSGNVDSEMNRKVSIKALSESLDNVMNSVTKNTELKYSILDKQIIVYKNENPEKRAESSTSLQQNTITITGRVLDTKKEPLAGVSICVKNTQQGTSTDAQGRFTLTLHLSGKGETTLQFSYIGFKPHEITVSKTQTLDIILSENIAEISEVVITGFVTKAKSSYTGAQTTVTREQLVSVGTKNVLASIQAFVPGMELVVDNNLGSNPNKKPEINIRGRASFEGAANVPIFIVDGSRVNLDFIYDMDLNDIETITVLKDASASALYGAKASAGVIVITTKSLMGGKLKFNYNGTLRASMPDLSGYHLLNSTQKLEYERLAGLYTSKDGGDEQYKLDRLYAERFQIVRSGVNTDWLSKPLQNAISQNHNLSVDGGDENARYNVGIRYGKEEGVMRGSGRERLSSFFKLSYNKDRVFHLSNSSTVSSVKSTESRYGGFNSYVKMNPYDKPYNENGELLTSLSYTMPNPLYEASLGNFDKKEQFYFLNTTDLQVWFKKDFRLDASFSFLKHKDDWQQFTSPLSKEELKKKDPSMRGLLKEENLKSISYSGKLILSYNKYLSEKLFMTSMGGTNIESNSEDKAAYESIGFFSDKLTHPSFASRYPLSGTPTGGDLIDRSVGFFANANMIYDNKYFLDLIYRYEGSSKFGKNKRFAPFWSVGSGWNIHHEKFMQHVDVQTLKLRASVGYLGNVSFSPYQSRTTYIYGAELNYLQGIGAIPITIGNPD